MKTKNLLRVKVEPIERRSWNARLIPKRLIELAKTGKYYESKVIGAIKEELRAAIP